VKKTQITKPTNLEFKERKKNMNKEIDEVTNIQSMLSSIQDNVKFSTEDMEIDVDQKRESTIFFKQASNSETVFGYLMHDQDPQPFFEDGEDVLGQLIKFKSQDHLDNTIEKLEKKKLFFMVDKYEHGSVHYSVSGTQNYPDQRWDVSKNCAVFIPCKYTQSEYKKEVKINGVEKAREKFLKETNDTLNSYSDWCNGDVYGVAVHRIDKEGKLHEEYTSWGYIGQKNAEDELKGFISSIVKNINLTEKLVEVSAKDLTAKTELPFRIGKKGLIGGKVYNIDDSIVVAALYEEDKAVIYKYKEGQEKAEKFPFEEWQKKHGVSPAQYLQARAESELKSIIDSRELQNDLDKTETNKVKIKTK